jgi:large subunit ribosomal protein L10
MIKGAEGKVADTKEMIRPEKVKTVEEVTGKLKDAEVAILTDYRGLTANEMTELRRNLREAGIDFKIFKNTLSRFAARGLDIKDVEGLLTGPTAIAFGFSDPAATAKLLNEFAKGHDALEIKGAIFEDRILDKASVIALAQLPSREVLLTQLAVMLNAPIQRLVNVLNGLPRKLAVVLNQIKEQKNKEV